ncbi:MAG: hypothetical protein ACI9CB_002588 [Rhodothermales bacterium]|jgi:hypothetical protein
MRYLIILFLTGCTVIPLAGHGVPETDNEPWPVLSEHRGTLGWVNKKCGTGKVIEAAGCVVPEDWEHPENGVRIYYTFDCKAALYHERRHASQATGNHTHELNMRLIQGRSICL